MNRYLFLALGFVVAAIILIQPGAFAQPPRPRDPRPARERMARELRPTSLRADAGVGAPTYIRGQLARDAKRDPLGATLRFFDRHGAAWGIDAPRQALQLRRQNTDALGYTTLRFAQRVGDVPVLGGDLRVQIGPGGVLDTINGELIPNVQPPAMEPRITAAAVGQQAKRLVGGELQRPPQLAIARVNDVDYLIWELWLFDAAKPARWHLWIDALDGAVLRQNDTLAFARQRETYIAESGIDLPGALQRSENDGPVADADVNAAHDNAGRVYDYFATQFGRDSIDGNGMPIISSVHFGSNYNNAFWNGYQMVYGDGNGVTFGPLARSLDVVAHELTHGITQYTAALSYEGEGGSLNESFSDIFGALIDDANWEIADDVYTPGISGDALRSLADPTRFGDPSVWGEYLRLPPNTAPTSSNDYEYIHSNSGVWNHIAYEIATTIGRTKTAYIFYRTLTQKLTSGSDFLDARDLLQQSCDELIGTVGITAQDCGDVRMALRRSGLGQNSAPAPVGDLPHRVALPLIGNGTTGGTPRLAPPAIPACGTELIGNRGFESGQTRWVTDDPDGTTISSDVVSNGSRSAQLSSNYRLLQWTPLPPNVRDATLRFKVYRVGSAASNQRTLDVRVETSDGATFATAATISGAQAGNAWLSYSAPLDVRTLRDLRIVFGNVSGIHYIDDVSLTTSCP